MVIQYNKRNDRFIREVFDYFNGRVNTFQKARLFINWCDLQSNTNGGLTTNPNCVIIYPKTIARYSNNELEYNYKIILVIIHELYHVDQCINYSKYAIDIEYRNMIENNVEVQSMAYLCNHINEINSRFNLDIEILDTNATEYLNQYSDGTLYHRKKYLDHIISIAIELFSNEYFINNKVEEFITQYFNYPLSIIKIIINNQILIIKNYNSIVSVDILNNFMYNNYYCRNYIKKSYGDIYTEGNALIIEIKAELYNFVCEQIKK